MVCKGLEFEEVRCSCSLLVRIHDVEGRIVGGLGHSQGKMTNPLQYSSFDRGWERCSDVNTA